MAQPNWLHRLRTRWNSAHQTLTSIQKWMSIGVYLSLFCLIGIAVWLWEPRLVGTILFGFLLIWLIIKVITAKTHPQRIARAAWGILILVALLWLLSQSKKTAAYLPWPLGKDLTPNIPTLGVGSKTFVHQKHPEAAYSAPGTHVPSATPTHQQEQVVPPPSTAVVMSSPCPSPSPFLAAVAPSPKVTKVTSKRCTSPEDSYQRFMERVRSGDLLAKEP